MEPQTQRERKTYVQMYIKDKERLERLRDKIGLASMAVLVGKLLDKYEKDVKEVL